MLPAATSAMPIVTPGRVACDFDFPPSPWPFIVAGRRGSNRSLRRPLRHRPEENTEQVRLALFSLSCSVSGALAKEG